MESFDPTKLLSDFIRIRTDHPNPDYNNALNFLKKTCESMFSACETSVHEIVKGKPNLLVRIPGKSDNIVLLVCHMDVVPVEHSSWRSDPFSGEITEDKYIYGRGSQDMKSVGIAYLAALEWLLKQGPLSRSVLLVFTVDEEIGGKDGMGALVEHGIFDDMKIDIILDEGVPSPLPLFVIFNGERSLYSTKFTIKGPAGHGSSLTQDTSAEKLTVLLTRIREFRKSEMTKMASQLDLGQVVTVNVNVIHGGSQVNVIPGSFEVQVDIRIPPNMTEKSIKEIMDHWIDGLCDVQYVPIHSGSLGILTPIDCEYITKLKDVLCKFGGHECLVGIFPGATDSRYLRVKGIPAINISPFRNTIIAIHDHNEQLGIAAFKEGIEIYKHILRAFCNDP